MTNIKTVEEVANELDDGSERLHRIAVREITLDRTTTLTALCEGLETLPTINGMLHKEQALAAVRTTLSRDASDTV